MLNVAENSNAVREKKSTGFYNEQSFEDLLRADLGIWELSHFEVILFILHVSR